MQIIKKEIASKDASGSVKVKPVEEEDIYHLYNIISVGDKVGSVFAACCILFSSEDELHQHIILTNFSPSDDV